MRISAIGCTCAFQNYANTVRAPPVVAIEKIIPFLTDPPLIVMPNSVLPLREMEPTEKCTVGLSHR